MNSHLAEARQCIALPLYAKVLRKSIMAVKKPPRKGMSQDVVAKVLTLSRRRCALCFYLDGKTKEKDGQIAHLDGNPANNVDDNLAWLCLKHHSKYDSKTSQHKNYTIGEVKDARRALYRWVKNGMLPVTGSVAVAGKPNRRKPSLMGARAGVDLTVKVEPVKTEIVDGFFQWGRVVSNAVVNGKHVELADLWITLHVLLTNLDSTDEIAFVDCESEIQSLGKMHRLKRERVVVPSPAFIERPIAHHPDGTVYSTRQQSQMTVALEFPVVLARGIPKGGLVQFLIRGLEKTRDTLFQDSAVFSGRFIDGLGKDHWFKREAGIWAKAGTLTDKPPDWLTQKAIVPSAPPIPQVVLSYETTLDKGPRFVVENIDPAMTVFGVHLYGLEGANYALTSNVIQRLVPQRKEPLTIKLRERITSSLVCEDREAVRMFMETRNLTMSLMPTLSASIVCRDSQGNDFRCDSVLTYNALRRTFEVSHERCYAANAAD